MEPDDSDSQRTTSPKTVLVIAPALHYREALSLALSGSGRIVVSEGEGSPQSIRADVVLIDASESHAPMLIGRVRSRLPHSTIIGINVPDEDIRIVALLEAGANGFVPRQGSLGDIVHAMDSATHSELVCTPRISAALATRLREVMAEGRKDDLPGSLSAREAEVLSLAAEGLTNKQIAMRLHIEPATVKNHIHRILGKLSVHSRWNAISALRSSLRKSHPRREDGSERG